VSTSSPTQAYKLKAFEWLPLERWSVETLVTETFVNNKRYCKVCDRWLLPTMLEAHINHHIREEKARRQKIRDDAAAERERIKEAERVISGIPAPKKKAKKTSNISNRFEKKDRSEVVQKLEEALKNSGEATLAQISEASGIDIQLVRQQIKKVPGAVIVGQVKSGQRGRPAAIYGLK
jgi:hypothetical protein